MDNNPPTDNELDPLYRDVFKDPENGTPDNITQAGCLALARLGKEAWNAWRRKYWTLCDKDEDLFIKWENTADFSGFDFREESIDFQEFVFGHGARFDETQFGHSAYFCGTQFGDSTSFGGARFGDFACFDGAQFVNNASFHVAKFGNDARFSGTQFSNRAKFTGAQFGNDASFAGAQFGDDASFVWAKFGDYACFSGAQFGDSASFNIAQFGDDASFVTLNWASLTNWYKYRPGGLEAAKAWAEAQGLSPETFKSISFDGADFAGQVDFSGRAFEGRTSFGCLTEQMKVRRCDHGNIVEKVLPKGQQVVFGKAPLFHNCKLHQDTTFYGAKFPKPSTDPTKNDTAARAYRTLKLAFAQQQATRDEQFFSGRRWPRRRHTLQIVSAGCLAFTKR